MLLTGTEKMEAAKGKWATIPNVRVSKRCRRKEQRPAEILRAALHSFALYGFSGCRIDDIAAKAGISKGVVYLYFDSKVALFKAVVQDVVAPAFEFSHMENLVTANRGSWGSLLRYILEHWVETLSEPQIVPSLRLLVSDAQMIPELAAHCHEHITSRGQRLIEQALSSGMREHEFRALNERHVAKALVAPFYLFALWPLDKGQISHDKNDSCIAVKTCIETQIRGLLIRPDEF